MPQGRGRPPNIVARQEAARLRRQGLSLQELAREIGTSHQAVSQFLDNGAGDRPIVCRDCRAVVIPSALALAMANINKRPWCTACLAKHPEATFGERLRSLRLARGMTHKDLAKAVRRHPNSISRFECGVSEQPQCKLLLRLVQVLGPLLVGWVEGQEVKAHY
jgi:transcriptional regulator with XRE-family HTH domain